MDFIQNVNHMVHEIKNGRGGPWWMISRQQRHGNMNQIGPDIEEVLDLLRSLSSKTGIAFIDTMAKGWDEWIWLTSTELKQKWGLTLDGNPWPNPCSNLYHTPCPNAAQLHNNNFCCKMDSVGAQIERVQELVASISAQATRSLFRNAERMWNLFIVTLSDDAIRKYNLNPKSLKTAADSVPLRQLESQTSAFLLQVRISM
jgi:hypothetical protein